MDVRSSLFLVNEYLTFFLIFPLVLGLSLYLTIRLNFLQLSKLRMSFRHLFTANKENNQGTISHYEAVSAVLAGNFGTGNISGMAVAMTTGGPGSLVWMWITAFLGAIIQYASCLLAVKYRQVNEAGEYVGGPMYYQHKGLGMKITAKFFSFFTLLGALCVGNLTQVNSIILPLKNHGYNPLLCGVIIAFLAALVILGGMQRIAKFASVVVPIKASLYLGAILIILGSHYHVLLDAVILIFKSSVNSQAALGGIAGYSVMKTMTTGFDRGIFATDAGTGIVPILQAGAKTKNPVIDGVVTLVAPLLVMIVCSATALALIVTGAWQQESLRSTNMVTYAFEVGLGSSWGGYFVIAALIMFAYTTLIAWACCGARAMEFLFGLRAGHYFKYFFIFVLPFGALIRVDWAWLLADISISLMLLTNLMGVIGLSGEVIRESKEFFPRKKKSF